MYDPFGVDIFATPLDITYLEMGMFKYKTFNKGT